MPDQHEISEMARLLALMPGATDGATAMPGSVSGDREDYEGAPAFSPAELMAGPRSAAPSLPGDPKVTSMKTILEAFQRASAPQADPATPPRAAGGRAKNLLEDIESRVMRASERAVDAAAIDRPAREALVTDRTDNGVRIGNWQVHQKLRDGRKFFDVLRVGDKAPLVADLSLSEAATGIARLLHDGVAFNSREMRVLLEAEQNYAAALDDAILFRHRVSKRPDDPRRAVFEDRYDAARQRALDAKAEILRLARAPF